MFAYNPYRGNNIYCGDSDPYYSHPYTARYPLEYISNTRPRSHFENYHSPRERAYRDAQIRRKQYEDERLRVLAGELERRREMEAYRARMMREEESKRIRRAQEEEEEEEEQTRKRKIESEQKPISTDPTPAQIAAATTIQSAYRTYKSLCSIHTLLTRFESLRRGFSYPTQLDYQGPEGIVTVDVPTTSPPHTKLAYTHRNAALHAYVEELNRILVALDAVQSRGVQVVRERRKEVVRMVEAEAQQVERWWRGVEAVDTEVEVVESTSALPDDSGEQSEPTEMVESTVRDDSLRVEEGGSHVVQMTPSESGVEISNGVEEES